MSGQSLLAASGEQRDGLKRLAVSANRAEADRARFGRIVVVMLIRRGKLLEFFNTRRRFKKHIYR